MLVGLEGDVVKTLQSIKKGIELLDSRRSDLRAATDYQDEDSEDGYPDDAYEAVEDDEDLVQPARR